MLVLIASGLTYDPCSLGAVNLDSLRRKGLANDSSSIVAMSCLASAGQLGSGEVNYWRIRKIQITPCSAAWYRSVLGQPEVAIVFLDAAMQDTSTEGCRERLRSSLLEACRDLASSNPVCVKHSKAKAESLVLPKKNPK